MGKIYYDPYNIYECIYCLEPTPNDTKECDKCNSRYLYCSFDRLKYWFIVLFDI